MGVVDLESGMEEDLMGTAGLEGDMMGTLSLGGDHSNGPVLLQFLDSSQVKWRPVSNPHP